MNVAEMLRGGLKLFGFLARSSASVCFALCGHLAVVFRAMPPCRSAPALVPQEGSGRRHVAGLLD